MRFCEASAKDNFNVDEIFLKLVDDILSKVRPEQNKKKFGTCFICALTFLLRVVYEFVINLFIILSAIVYFYRVLLSDAYMNDVIRIREEQQGCKSQSVLL